MSRFGGNTRWDLPPYLVYWGTRNVWVISGRLLLPTKLTHGASTIHHTSIRLYLQNYRFPEMISRGDTQQQCTTML